VFTWNNTAWTAGKITEMKAISAGVTYSIAYKKVEANVTEYRRMNGYIPLLNRTAGQTVQITCRHDFGSNVDVYSGETWTYIIVAKRR